MSTGELDDRGVVMPCPNCGKRNRLPYERLAGTSRCGQCKTALPAPASPLEARRSADVERLIATSSLPIVIDYWAPWCGPCRMVAPELEKVAQHQAGHILVVKVNTDELADLGQRFRVQSLPTMAVFVGGREVARTSGARPAPDIEAFVTQALSGQARHA